MKMRRKKATTVSPEKWTADWIASIADGPNTMSARRVTSIEKRGGGIKAVAAAAKSKKVHLVMFEDDEGREVVAASTKRFKVIA
jgi:hypothetical protein